MSNTFSNNRQNNNNQNRNSNRNYYQNNQNNMHNNFSLTYDQRNLIRIYENSYNQLTRQINNLYAHQEEITNNINNIIFLQNSTQNSTQNYHQPYLNPNNRNNRNNSNNNNRNNSNNIPNPVTNSRRVYIEGRPYILDWQHQYIPISINEYPIDLSYNNLFNNYLNSSANNQNEGSVTYTNSGSASGSASASASASASGSASSSGINNTIDNILYNSGALNFLEQFYSNIPIVPTSQQQTDGTLVGPFCQIVNPNNNSCPITLESFDTNSIVTQIRGCGHIFNSSNIQFWFRTNPRCPICRYDIRDYQPPLSETPSENNNQSEMIPIIDEESEGNVLITNILNSENTSEERNSNSNNNSEIGIRTTNRNIPNLTGAILGQLFNNMSWNGRPFSNTSYFLDISQNEIIQEFINNLH